MQWRLDRFAGLKALAGQMGVPWTDRGAQQAWMRKEMLEGRYRATYQRILAARDGDAALRLGISEYENPQKHALAYQIRRPFLDRLRRADQRPTVAGGGERPVREGAAPSYPPPGPGYGVPLHKGGTGLSRYTDEQLREMQRAADARAKAGALAAPAATPAPAAPATSPAAAPASGEIEAARQRIQNRYTPRPASPAATPGLTGSGVPAIAPRVDTGQLSSADTQAAATLTQLQGLNATLTPRVDTSSLAAALGLVRAFNAEIAKAGSLMTSAQTQASNLRAPTQGGATGNGGGSSGAVRNALADNFA